MTEPAGPAEFSRVRWREGYDMAEVDRFVERVLATLDGRPIGVPVTVEEIRTVIFRGVRLREGYDMAEVDQFLDLAVGWLSKR